jgi:hypothetical protein
MAIPSETTDHQSDDELPIREKAYQLWQLDGAPDGKADQYWHLARELIEGNSKSDTPSKT